MSNSTSNFPHPILIATFPAIKIGADNLTPTHPGHTQRVLVEIQIGKIEGHAWVDMSVRQARKVKPQLVHCLE